MKIPRILIPLTLCLILAGRANAQLTTANDYNEKGITLLDQGHAKESIPYFDKAIELDPSMPEAYTNRGSAYDELGNVNRALEEFDHAIALDPSSGNAYFNRGLTRLRMGNYEAALADINRDLERRPTHARTYALRGSCFLMMHRYKEALSDFNTALSFKPDERIAVDGRAIALKNLGQTAESQSEFARASHMPPGTFAIPPKNGQDEKQNDALVATRLTQSLKANPNNVNALDWRCNTNFRLHHFQECIADATAILRLNPKHRSVYALRGKSYLAIKDYKKAISDLSAALLDSPNSPEILPIRAAAYHNSHDYVSAIADLSKAIHSMPSNKSLYLQRGFSYLANSQFPEAISDFTRWVEANPNRGNPYLVRGNAYLKAEQYEKAKADFAQALALGESRHAVYPLRASADIQLGHLQEAIDDCSKDIKDFGASAQTLKDRARAYILSGKTEEGMVDLNNAIRLTPNDPLLYYLQAAVQSQAKQNAEALATIKKALAIAPNDSKSLALAAEISKRLNNKDQALEYYRKVIAIEPNNPINYESRALLYQTSDPSLAEADIDKALSLSKDPGPSLLMLASELKLAQKHPKEAITYLDQVLPKLSNVHDGKLAWAANFLRSQARISLQEYELALQDLNVVIKDAPPDSGFYLSRANVLIQMGRERDALKDFEKSIELKPTAFALTVVANDKVNSKHYEEAVEIINKAIAIDPKYMNAYTVRALAYLQSKQFDKSSADIEIVLAAEPKNRMALLTRAMFLEQTGKAEDALQIYNTMTGDDKEMKEVYRQRGCLLFRTGQYPQALSDAEKFCKAADWSDEFCPYAALLGYYSGLNSGNKLAGVALLEKASATCSNSTAWPLQIINYALNRLSEKELLAKSVDNDKLTESHTYIGLTQAFNKNNKSAIDHFRWVSQNGNQRFTEYPIALAELERLSPKK